MISDTRRISFQVFIILSMILAVGVGAYKIGFYDGMDSMCYGTLIIGENETISCFMGDIPSGFNHDFSLPANFSGEVVVS